MIVLLYCFKMSSIKDKCFLVTFALVADIVALLFLLSICLSYWTNFVFGDKVNVSMRNKTKCECAEILSTRMVYVGMVEQQARLNYQTHHSQLQSLCHWYLIDDSDWIHVHFYFPVMYWCSLLTVSMGLRWQTSWRHGGFPAESQE